MILNTVGPYFVHITTLWGNKWLEFLVRNAGGFAGALLGMRRKYAPLLYHIACIHWLVLESQLPNKIVNLLFTMNY